MASFRSATCAAAASASAAAAVRRSRFAVDLIPCRRDNYVFMIHDRDHQVTAVVDPADADPVHAAMRSKGYGKIDYILNTHHHNDHTGGNLDLKRSFDSVVIGFEDDKSRIPGIDVCLKDEQKYTIGSLEFQCFATPGHTIGHCVYWFPDLDSVFVGDTLFVMGCGRLFEGSAENMFSSLAKLRKLPGTCKVYCAHEYTLANARFAATVEPDNVDLQKRIDEVGEMREKGEPTVPSTISLELLTNPFMRAPSAERLKQIRQAKDRF